MLTEREVFHPSPGSTIDQVNPELAERKARRTRQRLELARARQVGQQERLRQVLTRQMALIQDLARCGQGLPMPKGLRATYRVRLSTPDEQAYLEAAMT